jgi:hypothetical protein
MAMIRDLFLVLGVGVLGSQLLITLNSGVPIGSEAWAATMPLVQVSSMEINLYPKNPIFVRSIYVNLSSTVVGTPEHLNLSPTPTNPTQYDCHKHTDSAWHCPTSGLKVSDLEQVIVAGR